MSEQIHKSESIEISKIISDRHLEIYRPDALGVTSTIKRYEYRVEILEVINDRSIEVAIDIGSSVSPSEENPNGFRVDNSFVKIFKYKLDIKNIADGKPCVIRLGS